MFRAGKDKGLATPIPLGMAGLATSTFLMGVALISQSPASLGPYLMQALMFGGLVEVLAGMWAFAYGDPMAATSFTFLGAFFGWWALSHATLLGIHAATAAAVDGMAMVFIVSAVVTAYLWIASFYEFAAFNLTLLFLWVSMGLTGIGLFAGSGVLVVIGGISALVSGVIAAYASFAEVYNATSLQEVVPIGESRTVRERIEQDEKQRIQRLHAVEGNHQRASA
jgi:succinate-acetate transporter protein